MYKTDIEIAQSCKMKPIIDIAEKIGLGDDDLYLYGRYKAKIDWRLVERNELRKKGKLILVTAITPTPAGEGKTTTTVGLADGLRQIGKSSIVALREPSLGPVFGMKGGATGGGYAQVVPMEDINLHFTGDIHAITAANNLLAAMVDNHIHHGNSLNIDTRTITWKRCLDINDRQLRNVVDGLGGAFNGVPREDGFDITVASEIMAILCLAESIEDLKNKISNIIIGYNYEGRPITAGDIKASGAVAALLRDALNPNLVQTLEGTPVLIHGGPFANIAHGCNSVIATKMAMGLGDYIVTEAGFAADLGAEKFLDIKCRKAEINPDAVVVVATVRALKHHGGASKEELNKEDLAILESGLPNLLRHIENMKHVYNLPTVVAINAFVTDTEAEIALVERRCKELGVKVVVSRCWELGGKGAIDLAHEVVGLCETKNYDFQFAYDESMGIIEKIECIAKKIYRADSVEVGGKALKEIEKLEALGFGNLPVCIAKTQYSFSDNPKLLGAPENFNISVKKVRVSAGAGFIVVLTGEIMTMPGLPKVPAAEKIDVDKNGTITGLF